MYPRKACARALSPQGLHTSSLSHKKRARHSLRAADAWPCGVPAVPARLLPSLWRSWRFSHFDASNGEWRRHRRLISRRGTESEFFVLHFYTLQHTVVEFTSKQQASCCSAAAEFSKKTSARADRQDDRFKSSLKKQRKFLKSTREYFDPARIRLRILLKKHFKRSLITTENVGSSGHSTCARGQFGAPRRSGGSPSPQPELLFQAPAIIR